MRVYVWIRTDPVSENYHSEGGLMVVAPTLEEARIDATGYLNGADKQRPDRYTGAKWLTDEPDRVFIVPNSTPREVIVFPASPGGDTFEYRGEYTFLGGATAEYWSASNPVVDQWDKP